MVAEFRPTHETHPRRTVRPALPSWTRQTIQRVGIHSYRVQSTSRPGQWHTVNTAQRACGCEDWQYNRAEFDIDHECRPCRHVLDCEAYEEARTPYNATLDALRALPEPTPAAVAVAALTEQPPVCLELGCTNRVSRFSDCGRCGLHDLSWF